MREGSEKHIERKLAEAVKAEGGLCIKLLCDQFSGLPDRLCLFPGGRAVFVEVKSAGKKPRKLQLIVHGRLRSLGFEVCVIDNVNGIKSIIDGQDCQY